jgi:hypothetical protein
MQIGVAAGGPAADLSWRGRGVASPQDLAGFGIERGQATAYPYSPPVIPL